MNYIIDNNNVIYNFNTFYNFKDINFEEMSYELIDKQEEYTQHYIPIKNNISDEINEYNKQLNIELQQFKLENNPLFNHNVLNIFINPQEKSHKMLIETFNSIDDYFKSKDFQKKIFKIFDLKYNSKVFYNYHKLIEENLPNTVKINLKLTNQFNVNMPIIIKDNKTIKMKEYKYMSLNKLKNILNNNTVIQPTITLKFLYFNIEKYNENIKINYGITLELSKLIIYTNNFYKTIIIDLNDYYDNNLITSNNKSLMYMIIFYIILVICIIYKKYGKNIFLKENNKYFF